MKKQMIKGVALVGLAVFFTGCASGPQRIDASGSGAVTTMRVDIADFRATANTMVQELLAHRRIVTFEDENGKAPVVEIGNIKNSSDIKIDLGQIAGRINEDLINSGGLVEVIAWAGEGGGFSKSPKTDFLLEGEIMVSQATSGKTREKTYSFQLRLNDAKRGTTVWQKTVDVSKQKRSGGVSL